MGSSVGTAEERLVRRLPLPGLLRRSLEVRMVCTATVIGLLLIVLLLTFVTDRIRSEVFADQRDVILADAALRASVRSSKPTFCKKPSRSRISFKIPSAIICSRSVS